MTDKNSTNFSVIIPNFNGSLFLSDCLISLIKSIKNCPKSKFEIIIVDNGSIDNSVKLVKSFFQKNKIQNLESKILNLKTNTGFAFAVNQGINASRHPYSCVCNNDLKIESNWFELISKAIISNQNNPKISTYFGTVINSFGTKIESQGFNFDYSGKCTNISNGKNFNKKVFLKANKLNTTRLVWGAPAALIIYKKEVLQKVGMFDPDFFAYEEDVDLSLRLYNFGYQTLYIPKAICYHLGGATSKKMGNFRNRMDAKNWFYIIIKNYPAKLILKNLLKIFEQRLRNLSNLIKNTPILQLPKDMVTTYGEVFRNFPKMTQKRHYIQKLLKSLS
jgi:GT2 family glycosyltransferase